MNTTVRTADKAARCRLRSTQPIVVAYVTVWLLAGASVAEAQADRGGPAAPILENEDPISPELNQAERHEGLQSALRRAAGQASQNPVPAPTPTKHESWPVRHPVILGALIGVPIGLVLQGDCGGDCFIVTGGTVGAGAFGGLIASTVHKKRQGQPITAPMKAGLVAGTIGSVLVALFIAGGSWSN